MRLKNLHSFSLGVALIYGFASPESTAQQMPKIVTPPEVTQDENGLNLLTGKIMTDMPQISIPAAPRLTFSRGSDFTMYAEGQRNNGTKNGFYAVHYGNEKSASFTCDLGACNPDNGYGDFAALVLGPSTFTDFETSTIYKFNAKSYNYLSNLSNVVHTQYFASTVEYEDGEKLTLLYDTYEDPNSGCGPRGGSGRLCQTTISYRVKKVSSNVGYYLEFAYWDTFGLTIKSAAIYKEGAPTAPLARLEYNVAGTEATDLLGRVWKCSFDCQAYIFSGPWHTSASLTMPGDSAPTLSSTSVPGSAFLTQSVSKNGVNRTYSYSGIKSQFINGAMASYSFDTLSIAKPDGTSGTYVMKNHDYGIYSNNYSNNRYRMEYVQSYTDELGRPTNYAYEPFFKSFRLTGVTYPEGDKTEIQYDGLGNVIRRTEKAKPGSGLPDIVEQAEYGAPRRPIWYRDGRGNQTDYVYNSRGQPIEITEPADASGLRKRTSIEYTTVLPLRPSVERTCTVAGTCGTTQEFRTEYSYVGNTGLVSEMRQIDLQTGEVLRTCYGYDSSGNRISETKPLAGLAVCP